MSNFSVSNLNEMTDSPALFDLAPIPYLILDRDGVILKGNQQATLLLGFKRNQLSNKVLAQFIFKQDLEKLKLCRVNLIESRQIQTCEARLFKSDGNIIHAKMDWSIVNLQSDELILLVISDITYQKQILDTQQFLLGNSWSEKGIDFFDALAEYLSNSLKVDYVCIDKLHDHDQAETLAVYYDGHFDENVSYSLKDTPCGKVVGNPVCTFPNSVRFLFPNDQVLQDIVAESYVGITLWGNNDKPIGLIAVISRKPLENTLVAETVLKQVSIRAAAEIEHNMLIEKINSTHNALEKSSQAVLKAIDEQQLLNEVCQIIVDDCGFALVWIGFANNDEEKSVTCAASAGFDEGYLKTLKLSWGDNEWGRGPTGMAVRNGRIEMCKNMRTDPRFGPWREHALKRGYESSIVFPLKSNERTFGAVTIYSKHPNPFKTDEIRLLTKLTNDLAQGILSIRLRKAKQIAEQALKNI